MAEPTKPTGWWEWASRICTVATLVPIVCSAATGVAAMTIAFLENAPFSAMIPIGAVTFGAVLWIWFQIVDRRQFTLREPSEEEENTLRRSLTRPLATSEQMKADHIEGLMFSLPDIAKENGHRYEINKKQILSCTLLGPAVILPLDTSFMGCKPVVFKTDVDSLFFPFPKTRTHFNGVIFMKDCTLINCQFDGVAFCLDREHIAEFKNAMGELKRE